MGRVHGAGTSKHQQAPAGTSRYEQIPASTVTSLLHTIGFNGKEYSPLSAPQGAHHSPVASQCVSNFLMTLIDDSLISQYICKPIVLNTHAPYGTGHDYRPPTVKATYDDVADLNSPLTPSYHQTTMQLKQP